MSETFIHGVQTIEISDGTRPIQTARSSIIGIIGTAPDADGDAFPLNEPVLVAGNQHKLADLGTTGTLPAAARMVFAIAAPFVVFVRVQDDADANVQMSNIVGSLAHRTGCHAFLDADSRVKVKPRILIAPGFTHTRPTDGIASISVTEGGAGYTSEETVTVTIAGDGVAATGRAIVSNGSVSTVLMDNPGQGYTNATVTISAPAAGGTTAEATANLGSAANPVAKELAAIAVKLRAMVYVDGPNTTNEAAISHRQDYGIDRVRIFDPHPMVYDTVQNGYVTYWASGLAAGVQAWVDLNKGFWWDLSNVPVPLVGALSRPVQFDLTDPSTESNYLNENQVTTMIHKDGFRFWGLQTTATDPAWKFASVRRTADMIYESIENSILWAMDRPITANSVVEIAESVRAYLRYLTRSEALLGGDVWFDPDLNPKEQLQAGKVTLDFDIEPPAPLETLKFRAHRNNGYYEELVTEVIERLAT